MLDYHVGNDLVRMCGYAQVSAEALGHAGVATKSVGTYIGCMFVDYMALQREAYGMSSNGAARTCLPPPNLTLPSFVVP